MFLTLKAVILLIYNTEQCQITTVKGSLEALFNVHAGA